MVFENIPANLVGIGATVVNLPTLNIILNLYFLIQICNFLFLGKETVSPNSKGPRGCCR